MSAAPPRTTRALATLEEAPAELRTCLCAHLEKRLPDHPATTLMGSGGSMIAAVLTESEVEATGFFARLRGKTENERVLAVVTPKLLLLAVGVGDEPPMASVVLREGLEIADYATSAMFAMKPDHGLNLTGFTPGASERHSRFLGLGSGPDAEAFIAALRD